jgi:hypothetical protein
VKTGTAATNGAGGGAALGRSAAETLDTAAVETAVAVSRLRTSFLMITTLVREDQRSLGRLTPLGL